MNRLFVVLTCLVIIFLCGESEAKDWTQVRTKSAWVQVPRVSEHAGYITPELAEMEKASEVKQVIARRTKRGLLGRTKTVEHITVEDVAGNSETCSDGSCANGGSCSSGSCGAGGCSSGNCGSSLMRSTEVGMGHDYGAGGCSSGSCGGSMRMSRRMRRSGGGCGAGGCN